MSTGANAGRLAQTGRDAERSTEIDGGTGWAASGFPDRSTWHQR